MGYINTHTLIDEETGEVLKEKSWYQYDGFTEKGYKYRYRALHVKYFFDTLPDNLSEGAFLLLMMITELMNDENVLVYRVKRKSKFSSVIYKPMDKDDIREKLRYKYGQNKFDSCWRELTKHCIKKVDYHGKKTWAVNPTIAVKGNQVPYWLCEEFFNYITPHISVLAIKKLQERITNQNEEI
jgi:hypothetical protein